jgi:hypothetical protein
MTQAPSNCSMVCNSGDRSHHGSVQGSVTSTLKSLKGFALTVRIRQIPLLVDGRAREQLDPFGTAEAGWGANTSRASIADRESWRRNVQGCWKLKGGRYQSSSGTGAAQVSPGRRPRRIDTLRVKSDGSPTVVLLGPRLCVCPGVHFHEASPLVGYTTMTGRELKRSRSILR